MFVLQRALTPAHSRSCTPSQQTTSFGMGDDVDASDELARDDDLLAYESQQLGALNDKLSLL